jgi:hypothetical protein
MQVARFVEHQLMAGATLTLNPAAMDDLLTGADGPVVLYLIQLGDAIIALARIELAPHSKSSNLSKSIVKRFSTTEAGPILNVVAGLGLKDPNYAYWVHEGNAPAGSRITSTTPGNRLHFLNQSGADVFPLSVKASKPIRYLSDPLERVVSGGML